MNEINNLTTDTEKLIWLAGFFEGEGTIHITKRGYLDIKITSADREILSFIQSFAGGKIYEQKNGITIDGKEKKIFRLCFYGKSGCDFLKKILPHLRHRKKQAELAINFYRHGRKNIKLYRSLINKWGDRRNENENKDDA